MTDDGLGADAIAGDGIYTGIIPGIASGKIAAFRVEAADTHSATAIFPANYPSKECLVRVGEVVQNSNFGTYRLWLTDATIKSWQNRPVLSNEELGGTFVYGNQRVVYNIGIRYSGSPWHQSAATSPTGNAMTYAMTVPEDDQVLGATSFNKIHAPGNSPGDDSTVQCEQIAYWMVRQTGLPWNYQRYINLFINGGRRGTYMEDTQVPGNDVTEELYPDNPEGSLYKLSGWYEFDFAASGSMNFNSQVDWCTLNNFTTAYGDKKVARYRYNWSPRAVHGTANDYSNVFGLVDAFKTTGEAFYNNVETVADSSQWMRTFAVEHAVGNWDSFGYRNGQNMYAFKPKGRQMENDHLGFQYRCWQ